jgi:hypothetical protein
MQKENVQITIVSDGKQPIEFITREGKAPEIFYPKKIRSKGLIDSPFLYSRLVKDKDKALVEYSVSGLHIKLMSDPSSEIGTEIEGQLSKNPDFIAFGINKNKFFISSELITFARTHSHCFANIKDVKELIESLQNFEVKYEQTVVKKDNRQGETEDSVKNAIKFNKGEVKKHFSLLMPIHVGGPKVPIDVEIEIEKQGTAPGFAFYALELENIIRDEQEEIMGNEIAKLKDFVCIQIS